MFLECPGETRPGARGSRQLADEAAKRSYAAPPVAGFFADDSRGESVLAALSAALINVPGTPIELARTPRAVGVRPEWEGR